VLGVALLLACAGLAAALRTRAARQAAAARKRAAAAAAEAEVPAEPPAPRVVPTVNPMLLRETHDPHAALAEATRVFNAAADELRARSSRALAASARAAGASARWAAAARGDSVLVGGELFFTDGPGGARLAPGWRRVGDGADGGAGAARAYEHVDGRRTGVPPLAGSAEGAAAAAAAVPGGAFAPLAPPAPAPAPAPPSPRSVLTPLKDYEMVRSAARGTLELIFLDGPGGARLARGWRRVTDGVSVWYAHRDVSETRWTPPPYVDE